jgi:hypothetical protein
MSDKKWLITALLALFLLRGLFGLFGNATAFAASQEPTTKLASQDCLSHYEVFRAHWNAGQGTTWTRAFATTSRCSDINVWFSGLRHPVYARAFTCGGKAISSERLIFPPDHWRVLATNVRDSTCFKLEVVRSPGGPFTAYGVVAA